MIKLNLKATLNIGRPKKEIHKKKGIVETKEEVNVDTLYPVRIRMTIKRVVTFTLAGFYLRKDQLLNGEVVNHPNKTLLNTVIRNKINIIEKEKLEQEITGEAVTQKKKNLTLLFDTYANKKLLEQKSTLGTGTYNHKVSYLNKFNRFAPHIKLKDVDKEILRKYEDYCKSIGNVQNTVWSSTKFVKTILNASVADKIFTTKPHEGFKGVKAVKSLRQFLNAEELDLFDKFATNPKNNPKLINVANWFLFSCYCGLRYGDLKNFTTFTNGKVLVQTEKTKEIVSIFAGKKLIEIKDRITKKIDTGRNCSDFLEIIAAACGIEREVTFHLSRHTFAVQWLDKKGSIETLSKLLGHSTIKTTQIYAKISNYKIDNEMKEVFGE